MNLNEIKILLAGTIKAAFTNKKTLDKFDDTTGTLKYNGVPVNNIPVFVADDSPVGSIISFMGNAAPQDYLACDGAEYNIADYPLLAHHMLVEFGSYNYFGGDGETTFAVPDLRGEFLRGSGTAERNTGSGGEVGEHQDGTRHQNFYIGPSNIGFYGPSEQSVDSRDPDSQVNTNTLGKKIAYTTYESGRTAQYYVSRPTNTSVLYCIKYQITQNNISQDMESYSLEEQVIGRWIDGKPIYRKCIPFGVIDIESGAVAHVAYEADFSNDIDNKVTLLAKADYTLSNLRRFETLPSSKVSLRFVGNGVNIYNTDGLITNLSGVVIFEYTKTTDAENSFTPEMLSSAQVNTTVTDEDINDVIGGV